MASTCCREDNRLGLTVRDTFALPAVVSLSQITDTIDYVPPVTKSHGFTLELANLEVARVLVSLYA